MTQFVCFFLNWLAMIFPGQENSLITFKSKKIYIIKTNNKIPVKLLTL